MEHPLVARRRTSPGYRVTRLARLNSAFLDRLVESMDIGHGQIPYLCALLACEGLTQDELAAGVGVNRSATARALALLESKGLVSRRENSENRRQKLVFPSERARRMADDFYAVLDRENEVLFEGLSEDERRVALDIMDRMMANVQRALDEEES
ncbi:DNA-binding MarR family transcriptional regulator [Desulfobaculum xiamenense]|uniref:DNA-binding MarR family transcriptional regulator n=1 Tax=Desulfobaculum xiamenense TaxID=995050 RepID=A0A846QH52_9BACT|nr:MarR family transcriptional regulator [Desulfobaculum xiamenense]NJB68146.1 DNA-binding MarR family transcriptional regulator [Desulfobaculum xiamenense]